MTDHIRTARDGAVLTVTFDNPARRNALGSAALDRLDALADEIAASDEIRAVVLTGAGDRAFTSGFDLSELGRLSPERFLELRFPEVIEKWARLPVPVIGALNGACMGGGVHIAASCDALIAVPGVRLMVPAARFGFCYPPAAIRRVTGMLGTGRAARLLYLDQELVLDDLMASGPVLRVVELAALARTAHEVATHAATLAPLAVAGMKEMVREAPDAARADAIIRHCAGSEDLAEGLGALREKRPGIFRRR